MTFVNRPSADTTSHYMLGFVLRKKTLLIFQDLRSKQVVKMTMFFKDYYLLMQPILKMITPDCAQK